MSEFSTPDEIAEETGVSRQTVCFYLRQLFPQHEAKYWWRLSSEEKTFLIVQILEAKKTHPERPMHALRQTLFLVFD